MRPKGMEDLVAFSAREVKREQQQGKEKKTSIHISELSENLKERPGERDG